MINQYGGKGLKKENNRINKDTFGLPFSDLRILSAITEYAEKSPVRLHMPGHKGRGGIKGLFPEPFDVTELGAIDNGKVVAAAENDVKEILGVKYLRFLTDGASAGILSALYAVKDRGAKVIVQRSAHKSVYNALELCGLEPVIINAERENSLEKLLTADDIIKIIDDTDSGDVIGAVLTYPDYYGRTFDIKSVSAALKERGKLFIADSAHGGHFKFASVPYAGDYADIFIDGLHKTFFTLNQGAVIGCNDCSLADPLDRATEIFSTTSPSYRILASIEYGEKYAFLNGGNIIKNISARVEKLKYALTKRGVIFAPVSDPFKICVDFGGMGISPFKEEETLEKEKIFAEMNDGRYILFMLSFATKIKDIAALENALEKIIADGNLKNTFKAEEFTDSFPERAMPYLAAAGSEKELTPLSRAEGKTAAKNAGRFPPCTPRIVAGERIDKSVIKFFYDGGDFFGIKDGMIYTVKEKR